MYDGYINWILLNFYFLLALLTTPGPTKEGDGADKSGQIV